MNIGVVHWAFPPVIGGVEMHLLTLCPEMAKRGAKVYVLTASLEGVPRDEIIAGVKVMRRRELSPLVLEELRERGGDIYGVARKTFQDFLGDNRIQVVQAHNLHMDYFDFSRALVDTCLEKDIPVYLVIHNHEFIDRDEQIMGKILGDLPWSKLVCISRYVTDSLKRKVPKIPLERWLTIFHGIDLEQFSPLNPAEKEELKEEYGFSDRRIIIHPARILPWKGIIPALQAIPLVAAHFPDTLLVLTGRAKLVIKREDEISRYYELISSLIRELKIEKHIHIGNYLHGDIPRLISLAEVLIYTTTGDEPFGLCAVEGMACGVPVIVTKSGGLVESVVDGKTGFIIDREESKIPEQLVERIIQLFSNPFLTKRMGKQGRIRAEKLFDKRRMATDFLKLSEELRKIH